jgi:hypothetical protein
MPTHTYDHLDANAQALSEDQTLTRAQITALAELENAWSEGRGQFVPKERIEDVLHAFMCAATHDCVCGEPRPTDG